MWNRYFVPSFGVMLLVVGLHWLGSLQGYYTDVNWFDILMHFLGGVWTALFALWILNTSFGSEYASLSSLKGLILVIIAVGILWEIHELAFGFNSITDDGYYFDTIKDIFMDLFGTLLVYYLYRRSINKA